MDTGSNNARGQGAAGYSYVENELCTAARDAHKLNSSRVTCAAIAKPKTAFDLFGQASTAACQPPYGCQPVDELTDKGSHRTASFAKFAALFGIEHRGQASLETP